VLDSGATGAAVYKLNADGTALLYSLTISNLTTQPIAAHIHAPAPRGQNAGIVVFLYPANAHSSCTSSPTTLRCSGELRASDFVNALAGQPLETLLSQMIAGQTYTNVHTMANPNSTVHPGHPAGEARGQNDVFVNIGG
jgi:hypothetical protein